MIIHKKTSLLILTLLLFVSGSLVMAQGPGFTSIRGGVYLDADGDGRCTPGQNPAANINLEFENGGTLLTLHTGSDGTYGLVAMGLGQWRVKVVPNANEWRVSSTNPLPVEISATAGLVQTDVNFCVVSLGTAVIPLPTDNSGNIDIAALAVQSEGLLTNPPPPAPTPTPSPGSEQTAPPPPPAEDWLSYLNQFRELGDLPAFQERTSLSEGARSHARYMVVNDRPIAHNEDESNPLFSPAGRQAASHSNIFATSQIQANYTWGANFWVSAPFHLVPMLDPGLEFVGYGDYNQEIGTFHMAAVLDVRTELQANGNGADYPLYFPGDGSTTWVVRHSLFEWPDPLTSCSGYVRPTGMPIVLQLGEGEVTPNVTDHSISLKGQRLESCIFDETTYHNPDGYAQGVGRIILDDRDAIVIMPKAPLAINETYTVEIVVSGQTYTWSFSTSKSPPGQ